MEASEITTLHCRKEIDVCLPRVLWTMAGMEVGTAPESKTLSIRQMYLNGSFSGCDLKDNSMKTARPSE